MDKVSSMLDPGEAQLVGAGGLVAETEAKLLPVCLRSLDVIKIVVFFS